MKYSLLSHEIEAMRPEAPVKVLLAGAALVFAVIVWSVVVIVL